MQRGDEESFTAFVSASAPQLLHTAWLLCGDPQLAEDLVQEAYIRVYGKWRRVQDKPWAYTRKVLLNLNTDRWRRTRLELLGASVPDPQIAGAEADVEARSDLLRALATLPQRERQTVVLRYYADLSEQYVADLLGVSVGTVKSAASRGLAKLRAELAIEGSR